MSYISAYDKKGREAFFEEDSGVTLTLLAAVNARLVHPMWTLETEDWGFIKRAYDENKDGTSSRWENYNVFLAMCITSAICGTLWIVTNFYEIKKYGSLKWRLSLIVFPSDQC